MSLEDWVNFDWIVREPSSADELRSLLSIVDGRLKDAEVEAISDDLRFIAAFSATLTAANMALRASGFRARTGSGHHQHIAESLEMTIHAAPEVIRQMRLFSKKRNFTSYDAAGSISRQDVDSVVRLATQLREDVLHWISENHAAISPA